MMTKEEREEVRSRLAAIEAEHKGRLTPAAVVADARDPASPLHRCFTWDVREAAERHWLDQARALITSVTVVQRIEKQSVSSVYYVRDPSCKPDEQGYVSVDTLRTDADLAREALVQEFSRAADMLRRAKQLAKALEYEQDVDALVRDVVGLRDRVQAAARA